MFGTPRSKLEAELRITNSPICGRATPSEAALVAVEGVASDQGSEPLTQSPFSPYSGRHGMYLQCANRASPGFDSVSTIRNDGLHTCAKPVSRQNPVLASVPCRCSCLAAFEKLRVPP